MIPVHGAVAGLQVDLQDFPMMIWNAEKNIYIYIYKMLHLEEFNNVD